MKYKLYKFDMNGQDIESSILGRNEILGHFNNLEDARRELRLLCLQTKRYGGNFQLENESCAYLLNQDRKPMYMLEVISL